MAKPSTAMRVSRSATAEVVAYGEDALVRIHGVVDERFPGFGELAGKRAVVFDASQITRFTSFGVRQWLKSVEALPPIAEQYVVLCPPFFVDQLNMVKGFGGSARVVTLLAPYSCSSCNIETDEVIDVVAQRDLILAGQVPAKQCKKCGKELSFDEIPDSYFACVRTYGATRVDPLVADIIAKHVALSAAERPVFVEGAQPPPSQLQSPAAATAVPAPAARKAVRMEDPDARGVLISAFGMVFFAIVVLALVIGAFFAGRYT
jgi:hypothetical protein